MPVCVTSMQQPGMQACHIRFPRNRAPFKTFKRDTEGLSSLEISDEYGNFEKVPFFEDALSPPQKKEEKGRSPRKSFE